MSHHRIKTGELRPRLTGLVEDLMSPRPLIFWVDFLTSAAGLYACLILPIVFNLSWISTMVLLVAGVLFLYRCGAFLHEIVHLKPSQLAGFRVVYNLLFGFPFCLPLFLYTPHLDHHAPGKFSTHRDPEYAGWGTSALREFIYYLVVSMLVFPAALLARFTIMQLLTLVLGKNYRTWLRKKHSTLATSPGFERTINSHGELRSIVVQEWATCLYCFSFLALISIGLLPWSIVLCWYFMMSIGSALNLSRGSVNHGYDQKDKATGVDQMVGDSVNIVTSSTWSWFWSPLNTKYHRLHHLFPGIPYHSLEEAHIRLTQQLDSDHPYFESTKHSYVQAFNDLILNHKPSETLETQADNEISANRK